MVHLAISFQFSNFLVLYMELYNSVNIRLSFKTSIIPILTLEGLPDKRCF